MEGGRAGGDASQVVILGESAEFPRGAGGGGVVSGRGPPQGLRCARCAPNGSSPSVPKAASTPSHLLEHLIIFFL
ncbi:hypothetical protein RUM44_010217 [Polyplax serrata]|uniref:Uncharacterized protein n=1 Tax=Polyplax serrata TaxID=468196 RepID=A0ABR1AV69_POLSC